MSRRGIGDVPSSRLASFQSDAPPRHRPSAAAAGHIPALAPVRDELERLTMLDNWHNALFITLDWMAIVGAGAAMAFIGYLWLTPLGLLIIGSRMRALMNLAHQCSHRQLFRSRVANAVVGRLFVAWPLLISVSAYRASHEAHHSFLLDAQRDPEVSHYQSLGMPPRDTHPLVFAARWLAGRALLSALSRSTIAAIRGAGETRSERLGRGTYWGLAILAAVSTGHVAAFATYWLLPYVTTFQAIRFCSESAEHLGMDGRSPWTATRNWTSNVMVTWLLAPHHDSWHLVHHIYLRIPHYRLVTAHKILLRVGEYARHAHTCDGFFLPRRPEAQSVLQDMTPSSNADGAGGRP